MSTLQFATKLHTTSKQHPLIACIMTFICCFHWFFPPLAPAIKIKLIFDVSFPLFTVCRRSDCHACTKVASKWSNKRLVWRKNGLPPVFFSLSVHLFCNKHIQHLLISPPSFVAVDSADKHNSILVILLNHISPSGLFALGKCCV